MLHEEHEAQVLAKDILVWLERLLLAVAEITENSEERKKELSLFLSLSFSLSLSLSLFLSLVYLLVVILTRLI
jgi:hypothetical protein